MDWRNSIKAIKKAQEGDRLVIFVGAGVSKNSDIPTWSELIDEIAHHINYKPNNLLNESVHDEQKCRDCLQDKLYSQEEFLRIPEYFYQLNNSDGHKSYYEFIEKKLNSYGKTSNPINEVILKILPHHIITTNYDTLLEDSKTPNVQFYSVVSKDADLLSEKNANNRYIIKMHGDFSDVKSIVLKESDYINYEQNYPLISTFLRSLLINHTFLFVGYSLNDSNLNLIIGWINYFKELHGVKKRPMNFWLSDKPASSFETLRLKNKDIAVIDLNKLPEPLVNSTPAELTSLSGKKVYAYLQLILDDDSLNEHIDFNDFLSEKLGMLKSYRYVSREDIFSLVKWGPIKLSGYSIIFYNEDKYNLFAKAVVEGSAIIKETLEKAKIDSFLFSSKLKTKIRTSESTPDEIDQMYLDNDYINLNTVLMHCNDIATKIYYGTLLNKSQEVKALIQEEARILYDSDLITILLHKIRVSLATTILFNSQTEVDKDFMYIYNLIPFKFRNTVRSIDMINHSGHKNLHVMNELLQKQEQRNEYRQNSWTSGHAFQLILELQAYTYDYYHYFKINRLPLDGFSNPKIYFSYYVKAMLCSYSPISPDSKNNPFGIRTHREKYPLNEIDLDIVVKYVTHQNLSTWIKQYCVNEILFDESVNIVKKYENLCHSLCTLKVNTFTEYLHTFSLLIKLSDKDGSVACAAFKALASVFINLSNNYIQLSGELLKSIQIFTEVKAACLPDVCNSLIIRICSEDIYQHLEVRYRSEMEIIFDNLSGVCSDETKEFVYDFINQIDDVDERINRIYMLKKIIPLKQSKSFLKSHIDKLSEWDILFGILDAALVFDKNIEDQIVNKVEACYEERKKSPGVKTYPDKLKRAIDIAILMRLLEFDFDISRLEPYSEQSEHIRFILSPDTYDYSKVDMTDYMWENLIWSKEYGHHFIAHKNELLSESLKYAFDKGKETKSQQKIVYGLLLSKDELQRF